MDLVISIEPLYEVFLKIDRFPFGYPVCMAGILILQFLEFIVFYFVEGKISGNVIYLGRYASEFNWNDIGVGTNDKWTINPDED